MPDKLLHNCARVCIALGTDGLRAELTLMRATRAYAALIGAKTITDAHLRLMAPLALRHRLRRNPLDDTGSAERVKRCLHEVMG
jgi:magnesium chelatase subunit I